METVSIADPAFIFDADYGRYGPGAGFSATASSFFDPRDGELLLPVRGETVRWEIMEKIGAAL